MNSKRKARESSNSSESGASPVEKRAREFNLSSSPERSTEVFEMSSEALESKLDLILQRLETMDSKLEEINTTISNLESKFNLLEGRVEKLENDQSTTRTRAGHFIRRIWFILPTQGARHIIKSHLE